MTDSDHETAIRSVLVAFEDGTLGRDAMDAAVSMATLLGAQLEGIYVENETLLRAAQLPCVQEVTSGSATVRPIDAEAVQRSMHHSAELARQILEQRAETPIFSARSR